MAIEFKCQSCQKTLRVPDEFAGRKAKCPNCQMILQVPDGSETVEPLEEQPPIASPPDDFADSSSSSSPQPSYGRSSAPNLSPFASSNPYGRPPSQPPYRNQYSGGLPHRGGLILGLGIGSIVTCNMCFILGTLSLVLGLIDLKAMKAGQMDSRGYGLTLTGTIMGGVMTVVAAIYVLLNVLLLVEGL